MEHQPNTAPAGLSDDPNWVRAGQWLSDGPTERALDLIVLGVPGHRTSLSPTGADATPAAVRSALWRFSTWCASRGVDVADVNVADWGDLVDPDANEDLTIQAAAEAAATAPLTISLGGDNSITYALALGAFGDEIGRAGLVTLDAHHDIRDGINNGSPVRRLIEAGLDPTRIVQIGIADFANSREYSERAASWGIQVVTLADVRRGGIAAVMKEGLAIAGAAGGRVHVDFDLDVCDRSVAPGCPASLPGGLAAHEVIEAAYLAGLHPQVASLETAEVDATADAPDGRTVRLTARVVLEVVAGLALRRR